MPSARACARPIRSRSSSTAAATSGPARQPRPASSAPATKRTPSERSKLSSLRPGRGRRSPPEMGRALRERACPFAGATGESEGAEAVRRPVGEERDPDDPLLRDGAPESAVVGFTTIVPHHVVLPGGNGDRLGERTRAGALGARLDVAAPLLLAVAENVPVDDPQRVAGQPDDSLDERLR